MVEIAIRLAVIGFALVAIIGILPSGMNVQKENREETIIGQDASLFIDAIRSGTKGMDDLTNYVYAITNYVTEFIPAKSAQYTVGYTYFDSTFKSVLMSPMYPITNGYRIIGLLSRPKYIDISTAQTRGFQSNFVVAYVRSMSGPASEKVSQTNDVVRDLTFTYRVASDLVPYASYDPNWTNFTAVGLSTNDITARSNYWIFARNLQNNLYDFRLIFRWPVLPNGNIGNSRQIFRSLMSGQLQQTEETGYPTNSFAASLPYLVYFFDSHNYVKAHP